MSEGTKTAEVEPSTSLKKSLLAQVVAQEIKTSSSNTENKTPSFTSFSWSFGKKKTDSTNGQETVGQKTEATPGGFIFGSCLAKKVTNADSNNEDDKPKDASSIFKQFSTTSPGESFFSTANSSDTFKPFGDATQQTKSFNAISTNNTEPEHIETITGEEGERNLLHIACKFFIFDRETKSWLERGMGSLRINEKNDVPHEYRIVGRATGNQRVCINSKIFPEMLLEKMTDKRLKLSALSPDFDVPQLFVVSATPAAIANLQQQLEHLISRVKFNANRKRPRDETDPGDVPAKSAQNPADGGKDESTDKSLSVQDEDDESQELDTSKDNEESTEDEDTGNVE